MRQRNAKRVPFTVRGHSNVGLAQLLTLVLSLCAHGAAIPYVSTISNGGGVGQILV
jgi:hypothetical protein